jgi:hypothetical protein
MAFTTKKFKAALRESWSSFVFFIVLLALAVFLSYVEEWLVAMKRPEPLPSVAHYGSLVCLLADMIVFGRLLWDAISHAWSKDSAETDE